MIPSKLKRYWHTLRHLRAVQWYGRFWFRLNLVWPDSSPPPAIRKGGIACGPLPRQVGYEPPGSFSFLGERHSIVAEGWRAGSAPRLWRYHLHYMDVLRDPAVDAATKADLVAAWREANPPLPRAQGGTGWEPYPLSRRIVNWIQWHARQGGGTGLQTMDLHSLAIQARFLSKRVEHHLLGNHLWVNAKALVFAGTFFSGSEADRWREMGLRLLERELAEQVLADGGHFELSPGYHALFVEDLLDLLDIDQAFVGVLPAQQVAQWRAAVPAMLDWLRLLTHPDGCPGLFNDTTSTGAPRWERLADLASRLGIAPSADVSTRYLPASGYARLQSARAVVLADVGPAGPDYIPGHAHADALSFELSLDGERLLVNGGISTYETGPRRIRERGTAAHNTVTVRDSDSSEVWGSFRLGRRINDVGAVLRESGVAIELQGAFRGFVASGPPVRHERTWKLDYTGLTIADRLDPAACGQASARFHLAPGWICAIDDDNAWIQRESRKIRVSILSGAVRVEKGVFARDFGLQEAIDVLVVELTAGRAEVKFEW